MRRRLLFTCCAPLCLLGAGGPASAASLLYDGVPNWQAAPESGIGGFAFDLRGRLLYDVMIGAEQDYQGAIPDAGDSEWRTARFGADWIFTPRLKATTEFDIANDHFQPTDLFLAFQPRDGLTLQIGQFKEAFSLDELTSSRFIVFMERGSNTDYLDLARRFGAQVALNGARWSWTTAAQGAPMDGLEIVDGVRGVSSRVTLAPVYEEGERFAHLGAAIRYRESGGAGDPLLRYRQRPMARLSAQTVETPRFAESDTSFGIEAAYGAGPVFAYGEYTVTKAEGLAADVDFSGFYIAGGWFLTGDHQTYQPETGKFDRLDVKRELGRSGFGALELSARYDNVDLTDGPIMGGEQSSITLGATWYPTSRTRVMLNYIDADVEGGPYGDGESRILQTRIQYDW